MYSILRRLICSFDEVIRYIPSDGKFLDVRSGYGIFCSALGEEKPNLKIIGIEIDKFWFRSYLFLLIL